MLREALLELRSPTALERVQVLLRLDDLAGKVDEVRSHLLLWLRHCRTDRDAQSRLTADIELLTDVTRHMSATDAFPALRSLCQVH